MASTAFLDTEFNGFGGNLISMAIVMESGAEFYQVKEIPQPIDPWVARNVLPVLNKEPIGGDQFKFSLHTFLSTHRPQVIVADWPSDFEHLFREMLGTSHDQSLTLHIVAKLDPSIRYESCIPHNALEDARAIRAAYAATIS